MNIRSSIFGAILLFVLCSPLVAAAQTYSNALHPDGSINSSFRGSFDPRGYRLSYGSHGEPRFVPEHPLGAGCSDKWDTTFSINGANGHVFAVASDGAGNVYIGGAFTAVHNTLASHIAKWDGTTWSALGSGVTGGNVSAIAISGSDVYAAGSFTGAGGSPALRVAKWNGSSWSAMGSGLGTFGGDYLEALAVSGSTVYAGGHFGDGGGLNNIARWDGSAWVTMGGGTNGTVESIAVSGGDVYAGGIFSMAGGNPAERVAKWNGTSWSAMGTEFHGGVEAMVISPGGEVFIGESNGLVRKWTGTSWQNVGVPFGGTRPSVNELLFVGTDLYATGSFMPIAGNPANKVARWDGTQWNAVVPAISTSFQDSVIGIGFSGSTMLFAGNFDTAGGIDARNVTAWNGSTFVAFPGNGLNGEVTSIAVSGNNVYLAGEFTSAGSLAVNHIVRWNNVTGTWSTLGSGITGTVRDLAISGDKLIVAGGFSTAGGVQANNVAIWNGATWSSLGTGVNNGVNGAVEEILVRGEEIYLGGNFQMAGNQLANRVAKWNGASWVGFNSGVITNGVSALALVGNDLYVGVAYTAVDGPHYFLKYDGTTWTQLGTGMTNGAVSSLAVDGSDVIVAGGFNSVGGVPLARIGRWNSSTWSALGSGIPGNSGGFEILKAGSMLYAAGDFVTTQGAPASYLAGWNGSAWSGLGLGVDGRSSTLQVYGGDLFAGGVFARAGCNHSPFFARRRETVWTGATSTDWHNAGNWGGGSVPASNTGITISSSDTTITSADVTLSSLVVTSGRTVTIGSGRTLTVNGAVNLSGGTIAGPGMLVVNDLTITDGSSLTGLGSVVINENLYLGGGFISAGTVNIASCRPGAISGGGSGSFISAALTRCVNSTSPYRFPVGTGVVYAPVEIANAIGSGTVTVDAKSGAHPGAAGLPSNRLQRWWDITGSGVTQSDISVNYSDTEVVGRENWYRAYSIAGGTAMLLPTVINTGSNRATATAVSGFSSWTLAEGTSATRNLLGRATGPSGRGASGMIVTLNDDQGNTLYTVTNQLGYYRFINVQTFRVYNVRVTPKKFTFTNPERIVEFDEFTPSVDFVSTDH